MKINELIVFNPVLNPQNSNNKNINVNNTPILIIFGGMSAVILVFIILWVKVFRTQKDKESDSSETKNIDNKNSVKRNRENINKKIKGFRLIIFDFLKLKK